MNGVSNRKWRSSSQEGKQRYLELRAMKCQRSVTVGTSKHRQCDSQFGGQGDRQDRTGQDRTGQDRTGQDRTGQDRRTDGQTA